MALPQRVIDAVIEFSRVNNYKLFTDKGQFNIFYLEGMGTDGKLNSDEPNQFNDIRLVLDWDFQLMGVWTATTEPGRFYTVNPMSPKGAARIAFGQYTAWRVGRHGNSESHEALVQVRPLLVYRDFNRDGLRKNDLLERGVFGINQHWGYDLPVTDIGKASAGCLVGRSRQGHREFMNIVKSDLRYQRDKSFVFTTTVLAADKLGL